MVLLEEANDSKPHGPIPLISLLFIAVVVLPHRSDNRNTCLVKERSNKTTFYSLNLHLISQIKTTWGKKQMKELNSPIKFNVPYQTTTLLSSVALGRTTNIHGLHAS